MKTILAATDFSVTALNAANYAAKMAQAINADMFLLHVYDLPLTFNEVPIALSSEELMQGARNDISAMKEELIRRTEGKLNIKTEVRLGTFFHELKEVCDRITPYAVVIGTQGKTAAERLLLGGHAVYTMKHLMWPVIAVPGKMEFSAVKNIGLACDLDEVVDTVPIEEIKTLVNDFHARLHVLNTGENDIDVPETLYESGLLQEMLGDLNPSYHFLTARDTDESIMEFAEKNEIDLLVVLPKRRALLDRLMHKSHTKQLVLHSPVPVMAVHQ